MKLTSIVFKLSTRLPLFIVLLLIFITGTSFNGRKNQTRSFPTCTNNLDTLYKPIKKQENLFYIQLSENHNIIVYDINYNTDKTINMKEPVHTYWIRYSEKGQMQELTYFQKHLVYGLEIISSEKDKQTFVLKFVSYKKRKFYLMKPEKDQKYLLFTEIHGKIALLNKLFIQVIPRLFGLPGVEYVDLQGKDLSSGKPVMERVIP